MLLLCPRRSFSYWTTLLSCDSPASNCRTVITPLRMSPCSSKTIAPVTPSILRPAVLAGRLLGSLEPAACIASDHRHDGVVRVGCVKLDKYPEAILIPLKKTRRPSGCGMGNLCTFSVHITRHGRTGELDELRSTRFVSGDQFRFQAQPLGLLCERGGLRVTTRKYDAVRYVTLDCCQYRHPVSCFVSSVFPRAFSTSSARP
jgi:hypothetical protein